MRPQTLKTTALPQAHPDVRRTPPMRITNQAPGPRGFNARTADGSITQVMLQPGETVDDLEPLPAASFAGLVRSGDLILDGAVVERTNLTADEMRAKARREQPSALLSNTATGKALA
jgi:hypothetical protein